MNAKKILCIILSVAMVMLCACSTGSQAQTGSASTSTSTSSSSSSSSSAATTTTTTETTADNNINAEGLPIANEKVTLSVAQCVRDVDELDFETMSFYQDFEEKTNIHIEWEQIKQADWATKLNLMFASGEMTDIIAGGSNGELDCDEYGANQGLLLPLDDYIQEWMPLYAERLTMNDVDASMYSPDGKMYYIGYFRAEGINTSGHYFINTTWLDRVGKEMPTTVDELTEVFRLFKTEDPNQNGQADEVPFQAMFKGTMAGLITVFPFWGIPEPDGGQYVMIDDDGTVKFTGLQEGYREACEWLNLIYTEGLIDPECITQDQSVFAAKLNTGTVGYFPYWRLETVGIPEEVTNEFSVALPVHAEGYEAKMSRRIELPTFGAALSSTCSNIPAALRWIDAQLETETMIGIIPGHEGIFFNDEGLWETKEGWETPENTVPGVNGFYFAPADWYFANYKFGWNIQEKAGHCAWYEEEGVMEKISSQYATDIASMSSEDKEEVTRLQTEIVKFMDNSITGFMVNGVTDAAWEDYLKTLESLNVARYIELYQNAYDGYIGK